MTTRIRTKGVRAPVTGFNPNVSNSVTYSGVFQDSVGSTQTNRTIAFSTNVGSYNDTRASITDETGSVGGMHNCTSFKTAVTDDYVPDVTFRLTNPATPFGRADVTIHGSPIHQTIDGLYASNNGHLTMSDGASVALARVPSVSKEALSGLNSLYELKDCKAFLELIPAHLLWAVARRKRAESIKEFDSWIGHISDTVRSPVAAMQAVAGADLMWKFGVKPLLKDINSVHECLRSLEDKVRELLNQKFRVAGRFTDTKTSATTHYTNASTGAFGLYLHDMTTLRTTAKTWVIGANKRIDPSRLPSINSLKWKYLAESLGLSLDATDLWEAVPYSFVVDWFYPIQTMLEQFSRLAADPPWLLTDGAWSTVKTTTTGYTTHVTKPITGPNIVVTQASGLVRMVPFTRTDYQRTRLTTLPTGFPTTYIPDHLQWPSMSQTGTGIELLIQRIKRKVK